MRGSDINRDTRTFMTSILHPPAPLLFFSILAAYWDVRKKGHDRHGGQFVKQGAFHFHEGWGH